jgi:hypothetical protein
MGHYADGQDVTRSDHGGSSVVRNRYFYSMLLEAGDLAQDQAFHRGNVQRHLAELHGFGTVCGLRVEKTTCHEQVKVRRGVAVDCLGREIRVEHDVLLDLHAAAEEAIERRRREPKKDASQSPAQARGGYRQDGEGDEDDDHCRDPIDLYVSICYRETEERPVQAVGGPETCCRPACEMSRTRHGFQLLVTHEPPKSPRRIKELLDDLYKCEHERLGEWLSHWMTEPCWQCEADPCGRDHHQCLGLARVRLVPGGAVESIDNVCIRPLLLPTVLIAALAEYAITKNGREV